MISNLKRTFFLLNQNERQKAILLVPIIFLNSIVEILGLAAILPLINIIIQPEEVRTDSYLTFIFDWLNALGIDGDKEIIILLSITTFSAFLFKAIFGLGVNLIQTRFSFSVAHRITEEMWRHHFSKSIERLQSSDSGKVLSEINSWPIQFANTFLVGCLLVLNEILVVALIAIGLIVFNPIVFISIGCLMCTGLLLISRSTKSKLEAYSRKTRILEPESNTIIGNAFKGFVEIITFGASEVVQQLYLSKRHQLFLIHGNTTVLNLTPSKLYEVLAIAGVVVSILIAQYQNATDEEFVRLLTLMVVSAYRVMPSMSRINSAIMRMQSQFHVLDRIDNVVSGFQSPVDSNIKATNRKLEEIGIVMKGVTLSYTNSDVPVLANLSLSMAPGLIHGITGKSGSGKSTLINAILALLQPVEGRVEIYHGAGQRAVLHENLSSKDWLSEISYLSQHPYLFQGSLLENLTMNIPDYSIDEAYASHLLEELELTPIFGQSPFRFQIQEGGANLSGGQRQRVALIRALLKNSNLIVLDEVTSALDASMRNKTFGLLKELAIKGKTVILVTHSDYILSQCDTQLNLDTKKTKL